MLLLIKNGRVVNADKSTYADVLIEDGKILSVEANMSKEADLEIDAKNCLVIPGGVDPHVHLGLKTANGLTADDFSSGSKAALLGGSTTLIDFVTPSRQESMLEALTSRKDDAEDSICDYSFHLSPVNLNEQTNNEIKTAIKKGFPSFKLYMAYLDSIGLDDAAILKVMTYVANAGGLVLVHCENGEKVDQLRAEFIKEGKTHPKFHPLSRPNSSEAEAVEKIISFSKQSGCPAYIVHISTKEALELVKNAKLEGLKIYAETCPHYLLLDESLYKAPFESSAKHICSPPYRSKEDQNALWKALQDGVFDTIGSDHCQFWYRQKEEGKHDFTKIANGIGSIEYRLALLFTYGVLQKKISENQWIALVSANPAEIMNLDAKGRIEKGFDADIVIWDPEFESTISKSTQHQSGDMNVFEGFALKGAAKYVIKDGKIRAHNNRLIDAQKGKLLSRFMLK